MIKILTTMLGLMMLFAVPGFAADEEKIPPKVTLDDGSFTQKGAKFEDGKWVIPDGAPTYRVKKDGTIDWATYSGFRRYHDVGGCQQCHGPEGVGSTYAPALTESLKTMDYWEFLEVVSSGRENTGAGKENVMPALGDNKNVMCYIEDIYAYLKARSDGVLERGRPRKRDDKPQQAKDHEASCFG